MSLGHPIQLRLQLEKQFFYQEEAAKLGKPLASYLRDRLDKDDETLEAIINLQREVTTLRLMLEDIAITKTGTSQSAGTVDSTSIEMLMLLRQLCRPEQLKIAQSEINRLGFSVRQW